MGPRVLYEYALLVLFVVWGANGVLVVFSPRWSRFVLFFLAVCVLDVLWWIHWSVELLWSKENLHCNVIDAWETGMTMRTGFNWLRIYVQRRVLTEHGGWTFGFYENRNFVHKINNWYLLKKYLAPGNYLVVNESVFFFSLALQLQWA
jgi:hypothetical protein